MSTRTRTRRQGRIRKQMRRCQLFRWTSQSQDFEVHGPYSEDKNHELMTIAMSTNRKWLLVVTAYFIDDDGDYYEEMLTFPPFGPVTFEDDASEILNVIAAAAFEAQDSGPPEHYRDTCVALYTHSDRLERIFEDTDTIKALASQRAQAVHNAEAAPRRSAK